MRVKVTTENIAGGQRECAETCPIAHAVRGAGYECPFVTSDEISFNNAHGVFFWGKPPVAAQQFMADFDMGLPVTPFEFELAVDDVAAGAEVSA